MKETLKKALARTPLYHPLRNCLRAKKEVRDLAIWERRGRPCPPPHIVKQRVLREYAREYGLRIFVETGTYLGDMVEAMRHSFDKLYSIELSEELFLMAKKRFAPARHVAIIHGDSGIELGRIVPTLQQPTLFWLDGHYSAGVTARGGKDSPIFEELNHILSTPDLGHVIIIDDARCFGAEPGYPTLDELRTCTLSRRSNLDMLVQDDIIRLSPRR
jgi:predicted O-methyltransferase YrrM